MLSPTNPSCIEIDKVPDAFAIRFTVIYADDPITTAATVDMPLGRVRLHVVENVWEAVYALRDLANLGRLYTPAC